LKQLSVFSELPFDWNGMSVCASGIMWHGHLGRDLTRAGRPCHLWAS
jgi:hypothetical protein